MPTASRTGRIPVTEWPTIVARRQAGETYAAIARDYEVTGPAIKYIVDKAQADADAAQAAPDETPAPAGTLTVSKPAPTDQPAPAAEPMPDPEAAKPEAAPTAATVPTAQSPLAQRLLEAAGECAALIDRASEGAADVDDEIKGALHQVRRAVAAIEIELSRAAAPARTPLPARGPRRNPEPAARPAAAEPRPAAADLTADEGGFGTHVVQGTVKFFHADKGFGFIIPDGGGSDIYVPLKALRSSGLNTLQAEQRVRVAVTRGAKGPEAQEVEPVAA
jgi:cold shock CspA family protein